MKTPPELDDERIFALCSHTLEDGLLSKGMLEFLMGKDMTFSDSFECVEFGGSTLLDK